MPQVRALKLLQEEEAAAAARSSGAPLAEAAALRRAAAAGAARTVAAEARAAELLAALRERDGRLAAAAAELDSLRGRLAGAGRRGEALEARLRAQEARAAAAEAQARAAALRARQQARARVPGPGGRLRHLAVEFASLGGGNVVHLTRACVFCDVPHQDRIKTQRSVDTCTLCLSAGRIRCPPPPERATRDASVGHRKKGQYCSSSPRAGSLHAPRDQEEAHERAMAEQSARAEERLAAARGPVGRLGSEPAGAPRAPAPGPAEAAGGQRVARGGGGGAGRTGATGPDARACAARRDAAAELALACLRGEDGALAGCALPQLQRRAPRAAPWRSAPAIALGSACAGLLTRQQGVCVHGLGVV